MSSPRRAAGFPSLAGLPIARQAHWGRWVAAALILLVLMALGRAFAHGQIAWAYVGRFLTVPVILSGIVNTVVMAQNPRLTFSVPEQGDRRRPFSTQLLRHKAEHGRARHILACR